MGSCVECIHERNLQDMSLGYHWGNNFALFWELVCDSPLAFYALTNLFRNLTHPSVVDLAFAGGALSSEESRKPPRRTKLETELECLFRTDTSVPFVDVRDHFTGAENNYFLTNRNRSSFQSVGVHFVPGAALCEHAQSCGWARQEGVYCRLFGEVDIQDIRLCEGVKRNSVTVESAFDAEMLPSDGSEEMPQAFRDAVVQISLTTIVRGAVGSSSPPAGHPSSGNGATDPPPLHGVLFTRDECAPIEHVEIRWPGFPDPLERAQMSDREVLQWQEAMMLKDFLSFLRTEHRPDILVSYNGRQFDIPYIAERCLALRSYMGYVSCSRFVGDHFLVSQREMKKVPKRKEQVEQELKVLDERQLKLDEKKRKQQKEQEAIKAFRTPPIPLLPPTMGLSPKGGGGQEEKEEKETTSNDLQVQETEGLGSNHDSEKDRDHDNDSDSDMDSDSDSDSDGERERDPDEEGGKNGAPEEAVDLMSGMTSPTKVSRVPLQHMVQTHQVMLHRGGWTEHDLLKDFMRSPPTGSKMLSWKLDFVAQSILKKESKVDLPYREMFRLMRTKDKNAVKTVGEYCLQDSRLLNLLMKATRREGFIAAQAAIYKMTMDHFLHSTSSVFGTAAMQLEAQRRGRVSQGAGHRLHPLVGRRDDPALSEHGLPQKKTVIRGLLRKMRSTLRASEKEKFFAGARVIEPQEGSICLFVKDFASLYPSMMMAYNICASTVVYELEEMYGAPEDHRFMMVCMPVEKKFVDPGETIPQIQAFLQMDDIALEKAKKNAHMVSIMCGVRQDDPRLRGEEGLLVLRDCLREALRLCEAAARDKSVAERNQRYVETVLFHLKKCKETPGCARDLRSLLVAASEILRYDVTRLSLRSVVRMVSKVANTNRKLLREGKVGALPFHVFLAAHQVDAMGASFDPQGDAYKRYGGVLPIFEKELKAHRKAYNEEKEDLQEEVDKYLHRNESPPKAMLDVIEFNDNAQKAIKVLMNSLYGLLGMSLNGISIGALSCRVAAGMITTCGRFVLDRGERLARSKNIECAYGDTDSIFFHPAEDLKKERYLSSSLVRHLRRQFWRGDAPLDKKNKPDWSKAPPSVFSKEYHDGLPAPVKFEFEDMIDCWMVGKKKYVGLIITKILESIEREEPINPKLLKLKIRGIEVVRRDSVLLVSDLLEQIIRVMCKDRIHDLLKKETAEESARCMSRALCLVEDCLRRLKEGKVSYEQLAVTKKLDARKDIKAIHTFLALHNFKRVSAVDGRVLRSASEAPGHDSRMAYVILDPAFVGSHELSHLGETVDFAREHNLPVFKEYYAEKIYAAVNRLFAAIDPMATVVLQCIMAHHGFSPKKGEMLVFENRISLKKDVALANCAPVLLSSPDRKKEGEAEEVSRASFSFLTEFRLSLADQWDINWTPSDWKKMLVFYEKRHLWDFKAGTKQEELMRIPCREEIWALEEAFQKRKQEDMVRKEERKRKREEDRAKRALVKEERERQKEETRTKKALLKPHASSNSSGTKSSLLKNLWQRQEKRQTDAVSLKRSFSTRAKEEEGKEEEETSDRKPENKKRKGAEEGGLAVSSMSSPLVNKEEKEQRNPFETSGEFEEEGRSDTQTNPCLTAKRPQSHATPLSSGSRRGKLDAFYKKVEGPSPFALPKKTTRNTSRIESFLGNMSRVNPFQLFVSKREEEEKKRKEKQEEKEKRKDMAEKERKRPEEGSVVPATRVQVTGTSQCPHPLSSPTPPSASAVQPSRFPEHTEKKKRKIKDISQTPPKRTKVKAKRPSGSSKNQDSQTPSTEERYKRSMQRQEVDLDQEEKDDIHQLFLKKKRQYDQKVARAFPTVSSCGNSNSSGTTISKPARRRRLVTKHGEAATSSSASSDEDSS
uniref:DNA polymerase delta catalytic subunit n=1 Tax=Palpitomonas bilix TaxID=652834 RepID=A0A7S3CXA2_9EUKA|mmetsp:Transcript_13193/g.34548  ORF Transcript_13193/g.34548 Transcript_13193/m.34548 type:complete len:1865 (+) Transcript_13193:1504-7098(+)